MIHLRSNCAAKSTAKVGLVHDWWVVVTHIDERDWYTVAEVATKFGKTPQAVRDAADQARLVVDVVTAGDRRYRQFPKNHIDQMAAWPGNASRQGAVDVGMLRSEVERLRQDNQALRRDLQQEVVGRALAEQRMVGLEGKVRVLAATVNNLTAAVAGETA